MAAHTPGLSIRKIAGATGLSSSWVHQLLHTDEAKQIAQPLLSEIIGAHPSADTDRVISEAVALLWRGLEPQ